MSRGETSVERHAYGGSGDISQLRCPHGQRTFGLFPAAGAWQLAQRYQGGPEMMSIQVREPHGQTSPVGEVLPQREQR